MRETMKSPSPTLEKPRAVRTNPTTEEIALRAYHIFLERGGGPGNALEDWTQASSQAGTEIDRRLAARDTQPSSRLLNRRGSPATS